MGEKKTTTVVTVCTDDKCKDKKAKKVRKRLCCLVKERGLGDTVKVKKSSCLGKCKKGPVVQVKPGKRQFHEVTPGEVGALISSLEN